MHRSCHFARTADEIPVFAFKRSRHQPSCLRVRRPGPFLFSETVLGEYALVTVLVIVIVTVVATTMTVTNNDNLTK